MFYVLYYLKNENGCQKQDGFSSREKAWNWLSNMINKIDWYSIEEKHEE